jgi:branched-chain amino acid transport system ATP-binding protein
LHDELSGLLKVRNLAAGYGKKQVLNGVSIDALPGEVVAIIGHNGAGKSTLLKAIFGVLPLWTGEVVIGGRRLSPPRPRDLLGSGVAYVPQGNRVFTDLTVSENLEVGAFLLSNRAGVNERLEHVFSLFPALKSRLRQRAGSLSGGEKQMLALANVLIISPRLLLLDEPSLGLAPSLVAGALNRIRQISRTSGMAVLIVEQKVREVLRVAHRVYVLRNGRISFSGSADKLDDVKLRGVYF